MRKISILSVALVCVLAGCRHVSSASYISTGDGGWEWAKPTPSGHWSWGVFFLDDKTGWVVGEDCAILKTTDGGKNWAPQGQRIRKILHSVYFTDKDHGWAVGAGVGSVDMSGIILKTSDGGATWRKVFDGKIRGLSSVHFVNNQVGWAVGGNIVLKTTDGGETWSGQDYVLPKPDPPQALLMEGNDVSFVDENTGWIMDNYRKAYKTTDGGKTWTNVAEKLNGRGKRIQFVDAKTRWILTTRAMYSSTDGGATWVQHDFSKDSDTLNAWDFHFSDARNGVVGCVGGQVLRTTDAGKTWLPGSVPQVPVYLPSVYMADHKSGWLVGQNGGTLHTADGGATWQAQSWGQGDFVYDMKFVSANIGFAVGVDVNNGNKDRACLIMKTTDGGQTWSRYTIPANT